MAAELTHEATRELLGAYALDAVLPEERETLEAHLATCPTCRGELADHRETAALLASAGAPAPARVWDRIEASLDGPVSLEEARDRRSARPRRWMSAVAAAAAAALVAVLGVNVVGQGRELERLAGVRDRQGTLEAAISTLVDPAREVVELESPRGEESVLAVVLPDGTGYLVRDNLQPLPATRTYQLWALVGETQVSAGVLGNDPGITSFRAPPSLHGLAVTEERASGVDAPEGTPLVVGTVRTA